MEKKNDLNEGLVSVDKIARRLDISKCWVYRGCECGVRVDGQVFKIPHYKLGRSVRFRLSEVESFLKLLKVGEG